MRRTTKNNAGFTLIEVLIVVVVIGILASIAYPSYMESVRKSNRTDAKAGLSDVAQRLQRCFTAYNVFNHTACGVAASVTGGSTVASSEGFYTIAGTITAATFVLTATPVAGTAQAGDARCQSFTLDQAGRRNATGTDPGRCW